MDYLFYEVTLRLQTDVAYKLRRFLSLHFTRKLNK